MNEEEVQTAMSCEDDDDPPRSKAKMYVERGMQTVYSYDPDLSNTAIRIELRSKYPEHAPAGDDDDDNGSPTQTDLSYGTTEATLVILTEDEGEDVAAVESSAIVLPIQPPDPQCTEIESNVSFFKGSDLEVETFSGSFHADSDGETRTPDDVKSPSDSYHTAEDGDGATADDGRDTEEGGVSIQTGMVLGTGTVAPIAATAEEDKTKEAAVQTKFGGYPIDQSDTRIVEELQSRFPVHSQDAVTEPAGEEGGDEEVAAVPDESGEQQPPPPEDGVPEENTDDDGLANGDEETTKDADEGAEPAPTDTGGVDSVAQTVFSYDPMLSNSALVDELANAYPKHSTENAALIDESLPPAADVPTEDDAIPSSKTESKESFQSAVTSLQDIEEVEQSEPVDEAGGEEQAAIADEEAQTGIVLGVGNTSPENTSENMGPGRLSKNVQTVFGGYNVDQSDTKIVEELQFKDPVHSQRASLETVEEMASTPTEAVVQEPEGVEDEETNIESADVQDPAEGDVTLDAGDELSPEEAVDESPAETEESGEVTLAEEQKEGDEEEPIEESNVEASETADTGDDGTGVQTMLTCASDEELPSKATRFAEHYTQTYFSYNPDLSNTQILTELKTKVPEHEEPMALLNEEDEQPLTAEVNDDEGAIEEDEQPPTAEVNDDEGAIEEDGNAETDSPEEEAESVPTADEVVEDEVVPASGDEGDETTTPTPPEETDGTETGEINEQPEIDPGEGNVETEVPETEATQFIDNNIQTDITCGQTTENIQTDITYGQMGENLQTDIVCGIGSTIQVDSNNDKTQQTFFSYDSNVSNSQVIPELQSGKPIHSQLAVENVDTTPKECKGPCSKKAKENLEEGPDEAEATDASSPAEDEDERQDTGAQTQIIFGTGTSAQGINEKASNTYFTYDAAQSDTQILDELKTRIPVHSNEMVTFDGEDKDGVVSEDSLFNDDWEKNESSGEGEVEVQDINATHSKASDWLTGASDAETSDIDEENEDLTDEPDVDMTLVVESDVPISQQQSPESSLSVHISFQLLVGNSTNAMQMKLPVHPSDLAPNDADFTASFKAEMGGGGKNEIDNIDKEERGVMRTTLPILVTVTFESRTDGNGKEILEPVVDIIFQKNPLNELPALEFRPQDGQIVEPDETGTQSDVNDPLVVPPEEKREMEIQTDLVLGTLLFSESISSFGGEEGYDTANEGAVQDEELIQESVKADDEESIPEPEHEDKELILPSPPMEEPSSRTNVSWDDSSLDDVDNFIKLYDDLYLRVGPNDACKQQYVQQLVPSSESQDSCTVVDKTAERENMKITTDEMLYVPDKGSSLLAKYTVDRKVKVSSNRKLQRWGFSSENNTSNTAVVPESSFSVNYPTSGYEPEERSGYSYYNADKSVNETTASGRVLTAVATRVIFEFQTGDDDFLSTDGRAPGVKSKIAFQIVGSRDADTHKSSHVATLDLKECIAPSKVTYMADGELTSKILEPEGSPLELPIDGDEPLVLKLALPQSRRADESSSSNTEIRRVPFTIAHVGDETLTTTKDLLLGGSSLQFTVPLGDGCGTMIVTAKIEDNSSVDEDTTEVITMTTTFTETDVEEELLASTEDETATDKEVCECKKNRSGRDAVGSSGDEDEDVVEDGVKTKTVTAMFIMDGVPGEKQTKVLRAGGSPMYVNIPSSSGVPIRAKLALAARPDDETPHATSDEIGDDLKTKVSCKIIKDGVEMDTKRKLMEAGGSPLRFELPIGSDGYLTAKVMIPDLEGEVDAEGDAATAAVDDTTKECVCETDVPCECPSEEELSPAPVGEEGGDATTKTMETRAPYSGDRCFDVIVEALATYAREIDPLRKALEEITDKVKELNMPELAGIGEPPGMSYHSIDELDDRFAPGMRELMRPPSPPAYKHRITLETGTSLVSTTIQSRPNARQKRPATSPSSRRKYRETLGQRYPPDVDACPREYQRPATATCPLYRNPTICSIPDNPPGRCPLAPRSAERYQNEQMYMQQQEQRGSGTAPGGYAERPQNRCPYFPAAADDDRNYQPPDAQTTRNQAYGQPNQDPRYHDVAVRMPLYRYQTSTSPRNYDEYAPSAVSIRSRVYISAEGLRPGEREPRSGQRSCNPDVGYDDYAPQQRSPIAEMYIKLAQNSRSSQFYEEDEDSLYDDAEDDSGYGSGYQRRGCPQLLSLQQKNKPGNRGSENARCKAKPRRESNNCVCTDSATDGDTSGVDLDKKESYWCDPEDVAGSTQPGDLGYRTASSGGN